MVLDINNEIFILHIAAVAKQIIISIYVFYKIQAALPIIIRIFVKYFNNSNIFSSNSMAKLLEYTKINNHFINLFEDK